MRLAWLRNTGVAAAVLCCAASAACGGDVVAAGDAEDLAQSGTPNTDGAVPARGTQAPGGRDGAATASGAAGSTFEVGMASGGSAGLTGAPNAGAGGSRATGGSAGASGDGAVGASSAAGGQGGTSGRGGTSGNGGAGGASVVEPGTPCGPGLTCCATEVCDWFYYYCGETDGWVGNENTCVARPTSCDGEAYDPVCGCDGIVYDNQCAAHAAGVDLSAADCVAEQGPPSTIPCGSFFCDPSAEYCHYWYGDVEDVSYTCEPLLDLCSEVATPEDCCALVNETYPEEYSTMCEVVNGNDAHGYMLVEAMW